ncbi:MAG: hypothetical protein KJ899_15485 [Gammaproteobacteria bacterium]|nr:hypothetical protein [Gammaproteobacteria bacterium]
MADQTAETVDVADAPVAEKDVLVDAAPELSTEGKTPDQMLQEAFEKVGVETPETTPERETGVDETAEPSAEKSVQDELPEELPDDRSKANAAWKRHRLRLKELEDKLQSQQVAEQQQPQDQQKQPIPDWAVAEPAPPVTEQKAQPPKPSEVPIPFCFQVLARQAAGEENIAAAAESAREQIQQRATPKELLEIMQNARRGGYGEQSADIADLCREWLPVVHATIEERRQREAVVQETGRRYTEAWHAAAQMLPQLHDPKSADANEFITASKELAGAFGVSGEFFRALPTGPSILAQYVTMKRNVSELGETKKQLATAQDENRQLKRRLGIIESPQKGRQPPTSGERKMTPDEALAAGLRAAGLEV